MKFLFSTPIYSSLGLCLVFLDFNSAAAQVFPGLSSLNFGTLESAAFSNEVIRDIGVIADERPFEPATPLGITIGLDATVSVEIIQVPQSFGAELAAAGFSGASIPILPFPKLNLHKGLGLIDIGGSYMAYQTYSAWGAYIKVAIAGVDEGPTWALRLCYGSGSFDYINTTTWTPQILISRKIDFADPYLGVGYEFVNGHLSGSYTTGGVTFTLPTISGSGSAFTAFTGIVFRPPRIGIKISVEGAYSSIGANSLGAEVGIGL